MAETSASAEPETPPNKVEASTLTWPKPPRKWPTSEEASEISLSEMPPRSMSSPAKMKSGIASSETLPKPDASCCATTIGSTPR